MNYYLWESQVVIKDGETTKLKIQLDKHVELFINVIPNGYISLDGGPEQQAPVRLSGIQLGKHIIVAHSPGFEPKMEAVELKGGEKRSVLLSLDRAKVRLRVNSSPEGAKVTLDGNIVGVTPLDIDEVVTGEHNLSLELDGYEKIEQVITVTVMEVPVQLPMPPIDLTLQRLQGSITVKSVPSGAKIYIDGKEQGYTPKTITLPIGEYKLEVKKTPMYLPDIRSTLIQHGDKSQIQIALEPLDEIPIIPSALGDEIQVGEIAFLPYLKRLGQGRMKSNKAYLNMCGQFRLVVSPPNAHIYLDGSSLEDLEQSNAITLRREGSGSFMFENLVAGTHTLRVSKTGYNTELKHISVRPDSVKTTNVHLYSKWRFHANLLGLIAVIAAVGTGIYWFIAY